MRESSRITCGEGDSIDLIIAAGGSIVAQEGQTPSPTRTDALGASGYGDGRKQPQTLAVIEVQHDPLAKLPNGSRLSCGALKNDSFLNLRAPPASSAC